MLLNKPPEASLSPTEKHPRQIRDEMLFKNMDSKKLDHDGKLHLGLQVFYHQKKFDKGEQGIFWRNKLSKNNIVNNSTS